MVTKRLLQGAFDLVKKEQQKRKNKTKQTKKDIERYLRATCNASLRRMEIQSSPCLFSGSGLRNNTESLQGDTHYHSVRGHMDTYYFQMELL